jgi:hypothetical protein
MHERLKVHSVNSNLQHQARGSSGKTFIRSDVTAPGNSNNRLYLLDSLKAFIVSLSPERFLSSKLAPGALSPPVGRGLFQRILRTPFNALGSVFFVLAQVTDFGQFGAGINRDGAEIASLDTPGAAVAKRGIHSNHASLRVLRKCVTGAGYHTGCILACAAGHRCYQYFVLPNHANPAAEGIEFTCFSLRANILAYLTAYAFLGVTGYILVF